MSKTMLLMFTSGWMILWSSPSLAQSNGGQVSVPATVEQARQMLDLSQMPLFPGATAAVARAMAVLKYDAPTTAIQAFEFHQRELLKREWNELPSGVVGTDPVVGSFERNGFLLTVTVSGLGRPGKASVVMQQHGNVDLEQLSLPDGVEVDYFALSNAVLLVEKTPEETIKEVREHFIKQGWHIYGDLSDGVCVRKNAVMLVCFIEADETQMGKTIIEVYSELVSVDIPAPLEHTKLLYAATPAQLTFESPLSASNLFKFYQTELAKRGWKATTENPRVKDGQAEQLFRNALQESLTVRIDDVNGQRAVVITHHSAE